MDRHFMFKYALRTADTNYSDSAWRFGGQNYGSVPGWKGMENGGIRGQCTRVAFTQVDTELEEFLAISVLHADRMA